MTMTRLCDDCKARPFTTWYRAGDGLRERPYCPECFFKAVQACENRLAHDLKRAPRRIRPVTVARPSLYPKSRLALCGSPDLRIAFAIPRPGLVPVRVYRPEGSTLPKEVLADVECGLAIHPTVPLDPLDSTGWDVGGGDRSHFTVTHVTSGLAVVELPSLGAATAARAQLLALDVDWTASQSDLLRAPGWDAVRDLVAGWRAGRARPKARRGVSRHRATY